MLAGQGPLLWNRVIDFPHPERRLQGTPQRLEHRYQHPQLWFLALSARPLRMVFSAHKQDFFQVISGLLRLYDAKGDYIEIRTSDAAISPSAFQGKFEGLQPVHKFLWWGAPIHLS